MKLLSYLLGEEFLYVTPMDQDTIVRVTINGKKPAISKGFFLLRFLQKTLMPHGESFSSRLSSQKLTLSIFRISRFRF